MTRILLADDQHLFAQGLRSIVESRTSDFRVVGIACDGQDVLDKAHAIRPDIVLMDVRMPNVDGVEATRRLHATQPDIKIVMLTTYDDDTYVKAAIKNGAVGYLLKDVPPEELFTVLRAVRDGSFVLPEPLAFRLFQSSQTDPYHGGASGTDLPDWYFLLSRKERQILRMIVEGHDNPEIAATVNLAPQTVKNYVSDVYTKMGVHSRLEAKHTATTLLKYL